MGGISINYKQISECKLEQQQKAQQVIFNHDFSIIFMIQYTLTTLIHMNQLLVMQFKKGKIKTISRQNFQGVLLPLKNSRLLLKTCEQKGGLVLIPITASNNIKYLRRIQYKGECPYFNSFPKINCLVINKNESLIVCGGKALYFWTFQNEEQVIDYFSYDFTYPFQEIIQICFNQSETKVIISTGQKIIVYHYDIQKLCWILQNQLKKSPLKYHQFINDDILVVRTQNSYFWLFAQTYCLNHIESYVLNKENGQFESKMLINDKHESFRILYYCPKKKILVNIRQNVLKFINIKDDGNMSTQKIIKLDQKYDYITISEDLRYFVVCKQNLMKVFQLQSK